MSSMLSMPVSLLQTDNGLYYEFRMDVLSKLKIL